MRGFAVLLCAATLFAGTAMADAADSATVSVGSAINKAGRQRMLAQRMAKAWIMIGLGIQPKRGQMILDESQSRFEKQLAELRDFVPNESVRKAQARLDREWHSYRAALRATPGRQNALAVYDHSELTQEAAHRLTLAYEKLSGTPANRLVNIAGRQRMLSQRMAKFWLFQAWDVNTAAARMELNFARAEFASGMHQLYNAPRASTETSAAIEQLDRDWITYRAVLVERRDAAAMRGAAPEVVELSERILASIEQLVTLCEQQADAH